MSCGLLLICDPSKYTSLDADVSQFYRAAANRTDWKVWHMPCHWVGLHPTGKLPGIPLPFPLEHSKFLKLDQEISTTLEPLKIQAAFCRTLKPFPDGYLQRLQIMERSLRFLNRPSSKIRQLEPAFQAEVAGTFMPPTLTSRDPDNIANFIAEHGTVVAKRGNSTQAQGVFRIRRSGSQLSTDHAIMPARVDADLSTLLPVLQNSKKDPLQFMRYLPGTQAGDKRILVVAGCILGAFRRRSISGHWVNNVAHDGICTADSIGEYEREAIEATWPSYAAMGLNVLGYDFLLDEQNHWRISEINAGNVGGFARLDSLTGNRAMKTFLDWIEDFSQRQRLVELRPARMSDHAAISWIYQQAIETGQITMDDLRCTSVAVRDKHTAMGDRESLLVAADHDEVLGWGELKLYSPRAGYTTTAETSVYINQAEQRRGIGKHLQQALMQQARQRGFRHLVAKILSSNPESISFHKRFGYRVVGTQHRIGLVRGTWHDVVILEHLLY